MSTVDESEMRNYLSQSISSLNHNKLNGLLAEAEFRSHLANLGFGSRVSRGGWIARRVGEGEFAAQTAVFFPETIQPGTPYPVTRQLPTPDIGLHTICATFHQTGISAFFCAAVVNNTTDAERVTWRSIRLGLPNAQEYSEFPESVAPLFTARRRRYNFLRYSTDANRIPTNAVAEEYSKENFRIAFQMRFLAEISDVDGIFWGQRHTYPLEIKEKTMACDRRIGGYFGLDVGPFVKLSYYASQRGNLHSLFIIREIDSIENRNLINWWFIKFEVLARFASWVPKPGGPSMGGGASSVVCIPKSYFTLLNRENLQTL